MINITLTESQAEALAEEHNRHAKANFHISGDKASLLFHDNAEDEMETNGYFTYEIRGRETVTGNPVTINVYEDQVTIEKIEA